MTRKKKKQAPAQPPADAPGAGRYPPDVVMFLGLPETGKSSEAKRLVEGEARLVVWDPNDEYRAERCRRITGLRELGQAMIAAGSGPARLAYVTSDFDEFGLVCQLVRSWAEPGRPDRAPCCLVVEELGDVVPPGKAPRWWGITTRAGRHRGIRVRAVGHSPREVDKTALKMATSWRIHALGSDGDRRYLASEILLIEPGALEGLAPFEFVEVKRSYPRLPVRGVSQKR